MDKAIHAYQMQNTKVKVMNYSKYPIKILNKVTNEALGCLDNYIVKPGKSASSNVIFEQGWNKDAKKWAGFLQFMCVKENAEEEFARLHFTTSDDIKKLVDKVKDIKPNDSVNQVYDIINKFGLFDIVAELKTFLECTHKVGFQSDNELLIKGSSPALYTGNGDRSARWYTEDPDIIAQNYFQDYDIKITFLNKDTWKDDLSENESEYKTFSADWYHNGN